MNSDLQATASAQRQAGGKWKKEAEKVRLVHWLGTFIPFVPRKQPLLSPTSALVLVLLRLWYVYLVVVHKCIGLSRCSYQ
jgi:hypothetical protein